MTTARLTSFTDGVIAFIITIMVLDLAVSFDSAVRGLCALVRDGRDPLVSSS
ncbi:MAG: TMEM175 family protein [Sphingomicrobium sp.]